MKINKIAIDKIKTELSKIKDLQSFKVELGKLGQEIAQELVKLNATYGPQAKKKLDEIEKRYNEVLRSLTDRQKQLDKELVKARDVLKQTRGEVEKRFEMAKKHVMDQKEKLTTILAQQLKKQTGGGKKTSRARTRRTKSETSTHTGA